MKVIRLLVITVISIILGYNSNASSYTDEKENVIDFQIPKQLTSFKNFIYNNDTSSKQNLARSKFILAPHAALASEPCEIPHVEMFISYQRPKECTIGDVKYINLYWKQKVIATIDWHDTYACDRWQFHRIMNNGNLLKKNDFSMIVFSTFKKDPIWQPYTCVKVAADVPEHLPYSLQFHIFNDLSLGPKEFFQCELRLGL